MVLAVVAGGIGGLCHHGCSVLGNRDGNLSIASDDTDVIRVVNVELAERFHGSCCVECVGCRWRIAGTNKDASTSRSGSGSEDTRGSV